MSKIAKMFTGKIVLLLCILELCFMSVTVFANEEVKIEIGGGGVAKERLKDSPLDYTVTPADATVTFKSGDEKIIVIDKDGKMTAKGYGMTTITATATKGDNSDSDSVNYGVCCTDFSFASDGEVVSSLRIPKDQKYTIELKCPQNFDGTVLYPKMEWSSLNPSVFTVEKGVITPKSIGTATLFVALSGANNCGASFNLSKEVSVTIYSTVKSIAVDKELYEAYPGEAIQIQAVALPEDADDRGLLYSSDNKEFSVDKTGKVTLSSNASGSANISIVAKDTGTVSKVVKVKAIDVIESITPAKDRIIAIPGDSIQLSQTIIPIVENGVSFVSSSPNVTVDDKGMVKVSEKITKDEEVVITISAKDAHSLAQAKVVIDVKTDVSGNIHKVDAGSTLEYDFRTSTGVTNAEMIQIRNIDETTAKAEKIVKMSDGCYRAYIKGFKVGDTGIILSSVIDKDTSFYHYINISVQEAKKEKPEEKIPDTGETVIDESQTKVEFDGVTYEIDGTDAVISSSTLKKGKTVLKGQVIIAGKTYNVTKIKKGAFKKTKATNIVIPASVKEIGDSAFEGSSLTQITIGKNVTKIGKKAFYNSKKLKKVIVKGKKIKKVGKKAFKKLAKNVKYKLPKGVKLP